MSSTQSVLVYGVEVWTDAPGKEVYRKRAVMVVVGVIPVARLAEERRAIYKRMGKEPREVVAREEKQPTLDEWQDGLCGSWAT